MVYLNIVWYENESIIIRGYKNKISALKDTCDINDLFYIYNEEHKISDYFDFSEDLREDPNINGLDWIMFYLNILNNWNEDYCVVRYEHSNLKTKKTYMEF